MRESVRIRTLRENRGVLEILLVKERPQEKIKESGEKFTKPAGWGLPGGRRQEEESLYQAAFREHREETGLEADISLEPSEMFDVESGDHTIYFYEAFEPIGEIGPLDSDIEIAVWVPLAEARRGIVGGLPVYQRHLNFIRREPYLLKNPAS